MVHCLKEYGLIEEKTDQISLFRLREDLDYPIFIKVDLKQFGAGLQGFIENSGFELLEDVTDDDTQDLLGKAPHSRMLSITLASNSVMRQVDQVQESDLYGFESLVPREGYTVYRYKKVGIIVYSPSASVWKLGCRPDFGEGKDFSKAYKVIINRFLSWALAPMGVIGFWGYYSKNKAEFLRQSESNGEAMFMDMYKNKGFSSDDSWIMGPDFRIVKRDGHNKSESKDGRYLSQEEFISLLSTHCSFFDYKGLSLPVRQMIKRLSKLFSCQIISEHHSASRRDLSL